MKLVIGETLSSEARVRQVAAIRRTVHFLVNGKVEKLAGDPALDTTIIVLASRKWPGLWTRWQPDYRVPPVVVCEAVWQTVLENAVDRRFGGAFERGFVWGMIPGASGIVARERFMVGGGGLFLEHYMMCRVAGLSEVKAHKHSLEMAVVGGTTPLPRKTA